MSGEEIGSITCPKCGNTSYNPNDILHRYCGYCHEFHDQMLEAIPPEQRCYCGWHRVGECPHCPPGKTCADKLLDRGSAMPSSVCACND